MAHQATATTQQTAPVAETAAPEPRAWRLAIVGSRSLDGHPGALRVIRSVLDAHQARHADLVGVSGGAVGVNPMAEEPW